MTAFSGADNSGERRLLAAFLDALAAPLERISRENDLALSSRDGQAAPVPRSLPHPLRPDAVQPTR